MGCAARPTYCAGPPLPAPAPCAPQLTVEDYFPCWECRGARSRSASLSSTRSQAAASSAGYSPWRRRTASFCRAAANRAASAGSGTARAKAARWARLKRYADMVHCVLLYHIPASFSRLPSCQPLLRAAADTRRGQRAERTSAVAAPGQAGRSLTEGDRAQPLAQHPRRGCQMPHLSRYRFQCR